MSKAQSALEPTRNERELHLPSRNPAMNSLSTSKWRKSLALELPGSRAWRGRGCVSAAARAGGRPAARSTAPPVVQSAHWLLSLPSGTGAFSPVAFSLGLLLVMATAFPTPGRLEEDAKGDATSDKMLFTSPDKTEELIKYILGKISAMRKEVGRLAWGRWRAPVGGHLLGLGCEQRLLLLVGRGRSLLGSGTASIWSQRGRLCFLISPLLLVSGSSFSSGENILRGWNPCLKSHSHFHAWHELRVTLTASQDFLFSNQKIRPVNLLCVPWTWGEHLKAPLKWLFSFSGQSLYF